jgi:hypothetical protein
LRNRPGDRPFVGHADNEANLRFKLWHGRCQFCGRGAL